MFQVNNAGYGGPENNPDIEFLEKMLDVHLKGPFNITQRALPAITKSKGNRIYIKFYCPSIECILFFIKFFKRLYQFAGTIIFVSSLAQFKPVSITQLDRYGI